MSEYGDPAGASAFREAVANHLRLARGMDASPERIIVTAGTQEGINIIARLFVTSGTRVVVENPCYQGAALAFESFGASLIPLDIDSSGACVERLEGLRATLAYVTPSHLSLPKIRSDSIHDGVRRGWALQ
jgi:GntR family transcriptional regulator/MocR family aminotransferase